MPDQDSNFDRAQSVPVFEKVTSNFNKTLTEAKFKVLTLGSINGSIRGKALML